MQLEIAPQWSAVELSFEATASTKNAYTDWEAWADFLHEDGTKLRRPLFWDGGWIWRCHFASPKASGRWRWTIASSPEDTGLTGSGELQATPATGDSLFERHGLLRMSAASPLNACHHDGYPFFVVADTPWALPWRATEAACRTYAARRQQQGFNAALLMTVQPDMEAEGPDDRTQPLGFDRGFTDLPQGRLTQLRPAYFQMMDRLMAILLKHGIVPIYQPVFHGYGWKGRRTAGPVVPPEDYARYCRYLVARYGARPAIWLVGGDGGGREPTVGPGGEAVEAWDAYRQPTGIHYGPNRDNAAHQAAAWLDFQLCQSGHNGEHRPEKLADMRRNLPTKAIANGEPTYERMGGKATAAGWWQGHEAWLNLCAGGTFGVFYGAASLWQWKLSPDEPDHQSWCCDPAAGWRETLKFEGADYVGNVGKILARYDLTGAEPTVSQTMGNRALSVPGKLTLIYRAHPMDCTVHDECIQKRWRIYDPKSAEILAEGTWSETQRSLPNPGEGPNVVIFYAPEAEISVGSGV
ncbi:MAG: DUF4038 domain-containing protein [Opitutales bacterium]